MDNISLGLDAQVNHAINVLRASSIDKPLVNELKLLPGAFFSIDNEGEVTGRCVVGGDHLFRLEYSVGRKPSWLALHLAVGGVDLGKATVFGVACKSRAPEATTYRVSLRSAAHQGFVDAFLPKHVVAFSETSTHIDLLKLEGHEHVPTQADWRDLVLFFPTYSASFEILDLRVFII